MDAYVGLRDVLLYLYRQIDFMSCAERSCVNGGESTSQCRMVEIHPIAL
jgi:hypothetical protein